MSILLYLLKSAIILGVLFLFYRVFLEKEKMHQFNRAYLLFAIVFSFVVPILPTGIQFMELTTAAGNGFNQRFSMIPSAATTTEEVGIGFHFGWLLWTMYAVVFSYFGHQFIKSIRELIQVKKDYNHHEINGISIILMYKEISPFTFMNWIYINKKEYEEKKIDPQLIDHELVHALEKHSWDVIFIEALITIFWFNPILRAYKKAIQLNHEFLADDSVLKKYNKVQSYQHLLLDTIENNTMISLASNINFHLTQKRLKMMTKHSSLKRKRILVLSTVPLMIGMLLCFGNPAVSQGENTFTHETQESIDPDEYYKNTIIHFLQKDGKVKVVPYAKLSDSEKAKVPPPPPPPPTIPGEKRTKMKMKALSEGAIVKVTEDGNVFVNANGDMAIPKPPKPPKAPKPEKNPKLNKAPKPPKAPNAVLPPPPPPPVKDTWKAKSLKANSQVLAPPPPPPPPVSMEELIKEGADIYIDGKKATDEEARALSKNDMEDIETIEVIVDKKGKKSLYIKRK